MKQILPTLAILLSGASVAQAVPLPAPDSGSSFGMMALALVAVVALRRRFSK
jgi:hypothetical protein